MTGTRSEVRNNIISKGLDVVRQYASKLIETAESGVDKVVSSCEKNPSVHLRYMNFLRQRKTALDAPLYEVSSGRSMIEMLGVLAIIAVLTTGGITGYSKAMQMLKSNIQKNALTELMMTMIKIKPNLDRNMAGTRITDVFVGLGDMPENLTLAANAFWDKNNNKLYIYWGHKEDEGNRLTYRIYGIMLSQQKSKFITQETKEYCRNLLSAAKAVAAEINYIYYWRPGTQNSYSKHFVTGQNLISATPVDIHKHCDIILDDDALAITNFTIDFKTD